MPKYTITAPDGSKHTVTAPDGATQDQVLEFAKSNWQKSGGFTFQKSASELDGERQAQELKARQADPYYQAAQSGSSLENLAAGFHAGVRSPVVGTGQALGVNSQADVNEFMRSRRGLASTTAGKIGLFAGDVAPAVAASLVPWANTVLGSGVLGGTFGAMAPVEEGDSRLGNATKGALFGAAVPAGVAAAKTAYAFTRPFTEGGRQAISARALERFAADPKSLEKAMGNIDAIGAQSLAEVTGDAGIAQLQRTLKTMDPQVAAKMSANESAANASRVNAIRQMGSTPEKMAAAESARKAATAPIYEQANAAVYPVDGELSTLMQLPIVKKAAERAKSIAENDGRKFTFTTGEPTMSSAFAGAGGETLRIAPKQRIAGQSIQDLKMALDDMLKDPTSGIVGKEAAQAQAVRGKFVDWMERQNPDYKAARTKYAELSRPINQMQVADEILNKSSSAAVNPKTGAPQLYREKFAGEVTRAAKQKQTVRRATGFNGVTDLGDVMTPEQLGVLNKVNGELGLANWAETAGAARGSPTAQYTVGQDLLRQTLGPIGVPRGLVDSVFMENLMSRPTSWALKAPQNQVLGLLGDAVADPKFAAELVKKGKITPAQARALLALDKTTGLLGAPTGVGLLSVEPGQ